MPGQPRAGRPSPFICFQRRGLSEHQTFFGSPLYIYNTNLIYRTKSAPLILLIPRGNLRVGAGDKPTPRSARKRTWVGLCAPSPGRQSPAASSASSRQPRAPGPGPARSRPRRPNWEGLKIRTHFSASHRRWGKFDVKQSADRGPEPGRKELALGEVIFPRLQDLATGSLPRQQRQAGTAYATSVRAITGVTDASCITCKALKAASLLGSVF